MLKCKLKNKNLKHKLLKFFLKLCFFNDPAFIIFSKIKINKISKKPIFYLKVSIIYNQYRYINLI